jgi:CRISPR-associated protein Cas2
MADGEMLMVFCYDVADDRRRRRVAAVLEDRAVRVQESVFEARLTARQAEAVLAAAAAELTPADSLRMYAVTAHGLRRSRTLGGAPLPEDREFYLF